jgi:hypothetical protein
MNAEQSRVEAIARIPLNAGFKHGGPVHRFFNWWAHFWVLGG